MQNKHLILTRLIKKLIVVPTSKSCITIKSCGVVKDIKYVLVSCSILNMSFLFLRVFLFIFLSCSKLSRTLRKVVLWPKLYTCLFIMFMYLCVFVFFSPFDDIPIYHESFSSIAACCSTGCTSCVGCTVYMSMSSIYLCVCQANRYCADIPVTPH